MKKTLTYLLVPALIAGFIVAYLPFLAVNSQADISNWQKGASIYSLSTTDFSSDRYKESVRALHDTGANYVSLIVTYYQDTLDGSVIHDGFNTPTDQSLFDAINYAHSLGMKVMITPHLEIRGGWRAYLNPTDRDAWFTNYGNVINHLADIGRQTGAESMCLGTELIGISTFTSNPDNTQRWGTMIQNVRSRFSGQLTYSANWGSGDFAEEVPHIAFWDKLDFIGISAYYPLSGGTVAQYINSWDAWNRTKIKPIADQYGKQVLFTEVGYRSIDGAHSDPYNGERNGNINQQEQADLYQALFQFWSDKPHMAGVHLWNWNIDSSGGSGDSGYTPQHKLAENVMKQWFGGSTPPPPPPPPPGDQKWTTSATAQNVVVNNPVNVSLRVTDTQDAQDMIVDAEIYDANNNKTFQQYFEHQNISPSQAGQYNFQWTPSVTGTHTVKVGVFTSGWSQNVSWNDKATTFSVTNNPPPPPPTSQITSLALYNANTESFIRNLNASDTINLAKTKQISIQANTSGKVGSVLFYLDGNRIHIENGAPYTIAGNTGTDRFPWNAPLGTHTLKVSLFSGQNGTGTAVNSKTITLNIVNNP